MICQEFEKTGFFYEPILNDDDHNGVRLLVRLFVDRANKKTCALLSQEVFSEIVFFDLSKKHQKLMRRSNPDLSDIDDAGFGFDKDTSYHPIGDFFIFLTTIYNMIDFKLDRTPIIDSKGKEQGYVRYSLSF